MDDKIIIVVDADGHATPVNIFDSSAAQLVTVISRPTSPDGSHFTIELFIQTELVKSTYSNDDKLRKRQFINPAKIYKSGMTASISPVQGDANTKTKLTIDFDVNTKVPHSGELVSKKINNTGKAKLLRKIKRTPKQKR